MPSPKWLFISDVHLGAFSDKENRKLEENLVRLVDHCEAKGIKIFILGDFFDYWMEFKGQPPPLGVKILQRFQQYHENTGNRTLFITGNHDNWTNGYLTHLGFDVEHEYHYLTDMEKRFMLLHGDGLRDPKMKFPRPFINRFLRNKVFVKIYQTLLPPRLGWKGMKYFSGNHKKNLLKVTYRHQSGFLDSWVRKKVMNDSTIDAIIYGHNHQPGIWSNKGKICMNGGFFGLFYTVGLYTRKKFEIVIWDGDSRTFHPVVSVIPNSNEKERFKTYRHGAVSQ